MTDDGNHLMQSLGPHAQPAPASLNLMNVTSQDGKRWVVLVLSHAAGRSVAWLSPEDAANWASLISKAAADAAAAPTPLLTAPSIPQGLPLPGAKMRLPGVN